MFWLRPYQTKDAETLLKLFKQTITHINASDYSDDEIQSWLGGVKDLSSWQESFTNNIAFVAVQVDMLVGFVDMTKSGYLNRLYIHYTHQREGIATTLVQEIEKTAHQLKLQHITTHASITAKPFFLKMGFTLVKPNSVERCGVKLTNFIMIKTL